MRPITITLFALLFMNACGHKGRSIDKKIDYILDNPSADLSVMSFGHKITASDLADDKYSFLDDDAQKSLVLVSQKAHDLSEEKMKICGISPVLNDDLKKQITSIRDDADLTRAKKKTKIKAVFTSNRPKRKERHRSMQKCRQEKQDQITPISEKMDELSNACFAGLLARHTKGRKGRGHGKHRFLHLKKLSRLDDAQKASLNESLKSSECSDALAK